MDNKILKNLMQGLTMSLDSIEELNNQIPKEQRKESDEAIKVGKEKLEEMKKKIFELKDFKL